MKPSDVLKKTKKPEGKTADKEKVAEAKEATKDDAKKPKKNAMLAWIASKKK